MTCQILATARGDVPHIKCTCTCYNQRFDFCMIEILKLIDVKQYFYNGV